MKLDKLVKTSGNTITTRANTVGGAFYNTTKLLVLDYSFKNGDVYVRLVKTESTVWDNGRTSYVVECSYRRDSATFDKKLSGYYTLNIAFPVDEDMALKLAPEFFSDGRQNITFYDLTKSEIVGEVVFNSYVEALSEKFGAK